MGRVTTWLILLLTSAGCHAPIKLETLDRIRVEGPVVTQNKVVMDMPPVSDGGPVTAMPVAGPCGQHAPRVAILDVDGLLLNLDFTGPSSLGENPVALFREKLDAAEADPAVRAVVLRVNSPGGSVAASDIMWRDLRAFRARSGKPVVACLLDVGAGGAYYLASGCDLILANPGTVTGGIGVVLNLYNLREMMAQYNVLPQEVKSGKHIDLGSPVRKMSDEGKALYQTMANEYHDRFVRVVQSARPALDAAKDDVFDGRVFTARQAHERGLIDRIGYLEDAVAAAAQLGGVNSPQVVLYHRGNDPARSLYAVTPNVPLQAIALPLSIPGLDRSKLPLFLYLWQPEVTLEKLSGK